MRPMLDSCDLPRVFTHHFLIIYPQIIFTVLLPTFCKLEIWYSPTSIVEKKVKQVQGINMMCCLLIKHIAGFLIIQFLLILSQLRWESILNHEWWSIKSLSWHCLKMELVLLKETVFDMVEPLMKLWLVVVTLGSLAYGILLNIRFSSTHFPTFVGGERKGGEGGVC